MMGSMYRCRESRAPVLYSEVHSTNSGQKIYPTRRVDGTEVGGEASSKLYESKQLNLYVPVWLVLNGLCLMLPANCYIGPVASVLSQFALTLLGC
jgi:hypothetical protein